MYNAFLHPNIITVTFLRGINRLIVIAIEIMCLFYNALLNLHSHNILTWAQQPVCTLIKDKKQKHIQHLRFSKQKGAINKEEKVPSTRGELTSPCLSVTCTTHDVYHNPFPLEHGMLVWTGFCFI